MNSRTIEEILNGWYNIPRQEEMPEPSPVRHIKPPKNSEGPMSEKEIRRFKAARILSTLPFFIRDEILGVHELAGKELPDKYVDYILKRFGKKGDK